MEPIDYNSALVSILYVEDEQGAQEILCSMLSRKYPEMRLYLAKNGTQGLELFKKHRPDIVITDISMPLMDGISMSSAIKALKPETIIVAVTAYSDTSYLLNAIETGIDHYVMKPMDYRKFFSILDKNIAMILLERQVRQQGDNIRKNAEMEIGTITASLTNLEP
jgi:YesN/AraC family two-component response regulator